MKVITILRAAIADVLFFSAILFDLVTDPWEKNMEQPIGNEIATEDTLNKNVKIALNWRSAVEHAFWNYKTKNTISAKQDNLSFSKLPFSNYINYVFVSSDRNGC